jgi:hypothetical protein
MRVYLCIDIRRAGCLILPTEERKLTTSSKRRRNTEASARFRAKKKEREQAVEKRASKFVSFIFILSIVLEK